MIFRGIFIFLTIFSLHNGIKSDNTEEVLFEITDMNSIEKFIMENYNISLNYNNQSYEELTVKEKNKLVENVFREANELIEKLWTMKPPKIYIGGFFWDHVLGGTDAPTKYFFDIFKNCYYQLKSAYDSIQFYLDRFYRSAPFSSFEGKVSKDLHSWATSYDYSFSFYNLRYSNIQNMHNGYSGLISFISAEHIRENIIHDNCKYSSSFRQNLFNAYREFIIKSFEDFTENYVAGFEQHISMNLSIMQRGKLRFGYDKAELQDSLKKILEMTKTTLHNQIHYTYLCDSEYNYDIFSERSKEEPHLELGRLAQTIIIAEKDLSTTQSCSHNCNLDSIKDTINRTECNEFRDCYYNTDSYSITELNNNSRRYSYFDGYNSGNIEQSFRYGDSNRSLDDNKRNSELSSTYDWGKLSYCDYCICTCVMKQLHSPHIVTAISFRKQISNIYNNMAVVGFRFVKKDYMIHIQILESELLPYGITGKLSWKPLEIFDYSDTTEKYYVLNYIDDSKLPLELGVDYGHPDIMNLNDVMAPEKHVITGVRFQYAGDSLDFPKRKHGPIELQIRVTPFDFVKGKLINFYKSFWISPKEQVLKDELVLENPDNPIYRSSNIDPIITSNKFVKFRPSDLKKDAGQTTVPFVDGRQIKFLPLCPLSGVGLIHRGQVGSGGHLALKIFDFDMSPYFNTIDIL